MYENREEAGRRLSEFLGRYKGLADTIVLGLPRGGVVVAYEVAKVLGLPLDVICPRKIGAPGNPEYAIGAVADGGEPIFDEGAVAMIRPPASWLDHAAKMEAHESHAREKLFRQGREARNLEGKTVILVDDGIATGLTMRAAIQKVKQERAIYIVVAVPVVPFETLEETRSLVEEVICPYTPSGFMAIGEFYNDFGQTSNDEVIQLLKE